MQVLPSTRAKAGRPSRRALYTALFAGTIFTAVGVALLYLVFGGAFMTRFMPSGRPFASRVMSWIPSRYRCPWT